MSKSKLQSWFADSPVASILRAFLAIVLAGAINDFVKLGFIDFANWQGWIIAGLASVLPALSRLLNPKDELAVG